jgi:chemotaxis protein MotA
MDILTIAGVLLALGSVLGAAMMEGTHMEDLIMAPAMVLVFGGTFFATLIGMSMEEMKNLPAVIKVVVMSRSQDPVKLILTLVDFARLARREGLLILEKQVKAIQDPYLRKGIRLLVDGVDPEQVRSILETDLGLMAQRHKEGEKFFGTMAGFAPTLGVIGTVMGLVHMLGNLSDPGKMGPLIASAFIATLYGVSSANLVFMPIANKLKGKHAAEMVTKRLVLEGVLSIQLGDNPKVTEEKLTSFLPPKERDHVAEALKAKKA